MKPRILSIGTATPEYTLTQESALDLSVELSGASPRRARAMQVLYKNCGVSQRHIAIYDADGHQDLYQPNANPRHHASTSERMRRYLPLATPLAEEACHSCLARSNMKPESITHLVTVSCTGFAAPGLDLAIIDQLGLARDTPRVHVGFMGCHGAINGLRVAHALALAHRDSVVLLCCVELCSLHFQFGGQQGSDVANALFGDGAAACLIGIDPEVGHAPVIASTGSMIFENTQGAMGWWIGDSGFEMQLSPSVPDHLAQVVKPWIEQWLEKVEMRIEDIACWAIHPGGPRVLKVIGNVFQLDPLITSMTSQVLREHGNMSSPTILFILQRMLDVGSRLPIVAMAFGPGLVGEGLLLTKS